jgi:putative ABC transport system permease protein
VDALLQDVRYAWRMLVQNPAFAALTIVCLATGIGVNSTIFSVVDTVSIRPLPFKDAAGLVSPKATHAATGVTRGDVSYPELVDWRAQARTLSAIAGVSERGVTLTDRDESERLPGALVSWNLFPTIGAAPVLGRRLLEDDDRPGATPVVVLGHALWQRRYAGDPAILGRPIVVDDVERTVVGVMAPRFAFPRIAELWLPLAPAAFAQTRDDRSISLIARLAPGASIEAARSELAAIAGSLARSYREHDGWSATVMTLRDDLLPAQDVLIVWTMMGAVSLVLLIACANVANLLLARATVRRREIAVRTAIGAGRGRIVRQLLTESVLVAILSVPLGAALAYAGLEWLTAVIPPEGEIPYYVDWSMNRRVIGYTAGVAVVTGLVFGLAPALQAAGATLHHALKDSSRGAGGAAGHTRLRSALVVVEIALSLVLLVGASLFMRSFMNLQRANVGIDTAPLLTLRFFMDTRGYADPDAIVRRVDDIVQRVEALPGVASAFASNVVPLSGGGGGSTVEAEGVAVEPGRELYTSYFAVTARALPTLGIPIVSGRDLTEAEARTRSPVAVVNRAFAERVWPGRADVIGRRFRLRATTGAPWLAVVGVIGDARMYSVFEDTANPYVFVGFPYMPSRNTGVTIRVASAPPASLTGAVREEIRRADSRLPLYEVRTGDENRNINYWQERLFGWMFSIFGAVALLLAAIGIYGVLSYGVAQRTHEIGIRMALGASRPSVFRLILAHGARLAAAGIVIGAAGALAATRVIGTFLYNVSPSDPVSFVGTASFLGLVAVAAGYLPARRATAVDPIVALRAE